MPPEFKRDDFPVPREGRVVPHPAVDGLRSAAEEDQGRIAAVLSRRYPKAPVVSDGNG